MEISIVVFPQLKVPDGTTMSSQCSQNYWYELITSFSKKS